jgi:hypothetical protein
MFNIEMISFYRFNGNFLFIYNIFYYNFEFKFDKYFQI